MAILKEFKMFAMRGNVVDMAVGIIIGGAFGRIVTSLVNDILMPPIGMLIGGVDFAELKLVLKQASVDAAGKEIPAVTVNYGVLFNTIINFIIVAFAIFMVIKAMNLAKKKEQAAPSAPPAPSAEEKILTEIRDILHAK
jgi:large conductance mechanosensitive channel